MRKLAILSITLLLAGNFFASSVFADAAFDKNMEEYLTKDENIKTLQDAMQRYFMKERDRRQEEMKKADDVKLEDQFKNPIKVDIGKAPVKGKESAKVTIVEFSDFQCPFCSRAAATIDEVVKAYPNDVKIAFKNLPLPFHNEAKPAASAAVAAQMQGKFWEMYDLLFKNQQALGKEKYMEFAKTLGLNMDKFAKDMASEEVAKIIEADSALAQSLGVNGTPGFFINGVQLSGAQDISKFKSIIDKWLKK